MADAPVRSKAWLIKAWRDSKRHGRLIWHTIAL